MDDILHQLAPTLVAALLTWLALRLILSGRASRRPASRWGRTLLLLLLFAAFGVVGVLLVNLVWPGGETVGGWFLSTMPAIAASLLAVAGLERIVKPRSAGG